MKRSFAVGGHQTNVSDHVAGVHVVAFFLLLQFREFRDKCHSEIAKKNATHVCI